MRRLHLFELEDQPWVPRAVRDGATDVLDFMFERLDAYSGVAPQLEAVLTATGRTRLVDLCSGGGGGTLAMARQLRARGSRVRVTLSDLYPSEAGIARVAALGDARIEYARDPLDVRTAGGSIDGIRTTAGAIHHFTPDDVRGIVGAVVSQRLPLAFFDVAASPAIRALPVVFAPLAMAVNVLLLFVSALLLVPFVRPFRWSRLFWTYVVPVIPLLFAWDGTVSALRAYTPEELRELAASVPGGTAYIWTAGRAGRFLYLTGIPPLSAGSLRETRPTPLAGT
jgi:hypothetical protein